VVAATARAKSKDAARSARELATGELTTVRGGGEGGIMQYDDWEGP
jgi:predicted Rossmann-fold nucleotide-binding protein